MSTYIVGDTYIPTTQERKAIDPKKLEGLFSDGVPQIAKEEPFVRKVRKENITAQDLPTLESIDIKEIWEKVSPAKHLTNNPEDAKAIRPSRSERETNFGGKSLVPEDVNSIFDASRIENIKDSDYSKHAIAAGKEQRDKKANKGKPSQEARAEWEVVNKAKTTAEVPVTDRGIISNRTAFEPAEIPKVKISSVEKIIAENKKSAEAGLEAAKLKTELDNIMREKNAKMSGNWEDEALGNIQDTMRKKIDSTPETIVFAKDFTAPPKESDKKMDLNGLFPLPENPAETKETSIKRDVNEIKAQKKTRADDRSWETVGTPQKM